MDVEVTEDTLTVVPDAAMLSGTDTSAFPLYIDPTVTWNESERTLLRSDGYESYGWSNAEDGLGRGVGKCGTWNGYYCGPGYVQRLYFEFSPASLKGKRVVDATFRVTEPWAFQCDPRVVDLVRTNNISSSTTWSSRPKHLDLMVDRNVSAGRGSLCDPDSPDAPIEFNDNPDETNENLTSTVRSFAAGKFSRLTLMLKAHDETNTSAWKRFRNDAVLSVDYVGVPAPPTSPGVLSGEISSCETDAEDPAVLSDQAGKNQKVQADLDSLFQQLSRGNMNPGLGSRALAGTDVTYARGRNGGRLFFRNVDGGIQIVGESDKANESKVIARLNQLYGQ